MLYTWVNDDNPSERIEVPWVTVGQQEDASQSFGSGLTYTYRYFLLKFFGISTVEDDPDSWRSKQKEAAEAESREIADRTIAELWGMDELASRTAASVTLIFTGVLITALGLYDKLARKAGAGTLVPITGFANAVSAPAIEFKTEGFTTGIGAKMFSIAGSVLVYGVSASVIYGAVLWVMGMFGVTLY